MYCDRREQSYSRKKLLQLSRVWVEEGTSSFSFCSGDKSSDESLTRTIRFATTKLLLMHQRQMGECPLESV